MSCRCSRPGRWQQTSAQQSCRRRCRRTLHSCCTAKHSSGQQQPVRQATRPGQGCRPLRKGHSSTGTHRTAELGGGAVKQAGNGLGCLGCVVQLGGAACAERGARAVSNAAGRARCVLHAAAAGRVVCWRTAHLRPCMQQGCQPTLQHLASASASWSPLMLVALLVLPYSLPAAHTPKLGPGVPSPSMSPQVALAAVYCRRWQQAGQCGRSRNQQASCTNPGSQAKWPTCTHTAPAAAMAAAHLAAG